LTEAREFHPDVEDLAAPIATDFSTDSRTLMVTFGGTAGGVGIPPFEFFKITSEFGVERLFVRDLEQAMYHRSLPGMGHGPEGVVQYVKQKATEQNIERLVVMGNSGGGSASLLFGALLDANSTYAFSPVTFIGSVARLMRGDHPAPGYFFARRHHATLNDSTSASGVCSRSTDSARSSTSTTAGRDRGGAWTSCTQTGWPHSPTSISAPTTRVGTS
jgi:hypothetical protein